MKADERKNMLRKSGHNVWMVDFIEYICTAQHYG